MTARFLPCLLLLLALPATARGAELLVSVPQDEETDVPANAREFPVRPGEKLSLVAELYDRDGQSLVGKNKSYERPYPFRWRAECEGGCSVTLEAAPPVMTILVPDRMTGPITIEVTYAGSADAEAVPPAKIQLVNSETGAHARGHALGDDDEDSLPRSSWRPSVSAPGPAPKANKSAAKEKKFLGSSGGGGGGGGGSGGSSSRSRDRGGESSGSSHYGSEWGDSWGGGGGGSATTARGYNREAPETPVLACKREKGKMGPLRCKETRSRKPLPVLRLVKRPPVKPKAAPKPTKAKPAHLPAQH